MVDLHNLAYSSIISGDSTKEPMTEECAKITLDAWVEEGNPEYADVSPADFARAWNEVVTYFTRD